MECRRLGIKYLDATVNGMGRGAGNCHLEQLIAYLDDSGRSVAPVLDFSRRHMAPLRNSGVVWGYDLPYLLTGVMNVHPRAAIAFIREGRTDYLEFMRELAESGKG